MVPVNWRARGNDLVTSEAKGLAGTKSISFAAGTPSEMKEKGGKGFLQFPWAMNMGRTCLKSDLSPGPNPSRMLSRPSLFPASHISGLVDN